MPEQEYTPNTQRVRDRYVQSCIITGSNQQMPGLAFDRWLINHDAEVMKNVAAELRATIYNLEDSTTVADVELALTKLLKSLEFRT